MATTFMNLSLPTPTITLGPQWATQLNTAIESIDAHDHSSGKGKQIPTSGININADLSFEEYRAISLTSSQYIDQTATLTGSSNASSIYSVGGNLYWTNSSGVAVQITSGGSVVTTPASVQVLEYVDASSNTTIAPTDTFVYIAADCSGGSFTITLPLASSVTAGRVFIVKDVTGSSYSNPVTVAISGSDTIEGASSFDLASDYGSLMLISNGADKWQVA